MLTYNLDVSDGLTNGSQGTLVDIVANNDGRIKFLLIRFDVETSGAKRRKNNAIILNKEQKDLTPIESIEKVFSLSKKSKNASSTATVLQFPLRLAYAATAHKIQGHTIQKPKAVIADF